MTTIQIKDNFDLSVFNTCDMCPFSNFIDNFDEYNTWSIDCSITGETVYAGRLFWKPEETLNYKSTNCPIIKIIQEN